MSARFAVVLALIPACRMSGRRVHAVRGVAVRPYFEGCAEVFAVDRTNCPASSNPHFRN